MRPQFPRGITPSRFSLLLLATILVGLSPAWFAFAQDRHANDEGEAGTQEQEAAQEDEEEAPPTERLERVGETASPWEDVERQPRLRYPALTPDGETLIFTYQSDLYRVDLTSESLVAAPLSVHMARELRGVVTPDGEEVVYAAQYHGQYDLYARPVTGGEPRRITEHETHEYPTHVCPNGEWVLYYGFRDGGNDLYMTRLDGTGTPVRLTESMWLAEFGGRFSPDMQHVAYTMGGSTVGFFRPRYRGYNNSEIYVAELDEGVLTDHRRITDNTWHDMSPGWVPLHDINGKLKPHLVFFTYGEEFSGLVACDPFASDVEDEELPWLRPLLEHEDPDAPLRAPSYVPNPAGGFHMVAEDVNGVLTKAVFDVDGELLEKEALDIHVVPMPKVTHEHRVVTNSNVSEFALSPDGEKIAYVVNGEVFLTSSTGETDGLSLRVTETAAREGQVTWTPDGEYLIYSTLRRGQQDLVLYDIGARQEYWLVASEHDDASPVVSPKGDVVLYTRNDREVRMINLDGTGDRVFYDDGLMPRRSIRTRPAYTFSPKGYWVALETSDPTDLKSRLFIGSVDGEVPLTPVTAHARGSFFPKFTADEEYLTYYALREEGYTVFALRLVPEEEEFTEDKLEELFPRRDPGPEPPQPEEGEADNGDENGEEERDDEEENESEEAGEEEEVEETAHGDIPIVFDGIRDRARQLVDLPSNEWYLLRAHDGSRWFFLSNLMQGWQLWTVNDRGGGLRQVTTLSGGLTEWQFSPDGNRLYFLNRGRVRSLALNNFRVRTVPTRAEYEQDLQTERLAVYDEIGWVFARYFYDPELVESRWRDLHERFRPMVKDAVEDSVFRSTMSDLMGQLNYSHLGVGSRPGGTPGLGSTDSGELGLRFDQRELRRSGILRITDVLADGPADRPEVEIEPGMYLRAIDGEPLTYRSNLERRLSDTTGRRVRVTVGTNPPGEEDAGAQTFSLRPVSRGHIRELRYREWVNERRRYVEEATNGEFGYIHVPRMRAETLTDFQDEIVDMVANKRGVVIDVRYNSGGNTAVHMLRTLYREPWLRRSFRDVGEVSENVYRDLAWERPAVTLINERSFSNAEIFAEGFKRLGIGPVIGRPTGGGVIGTSSYTLVDGSTVRTPLAGAFTVDGVDLEHNPRYPDFWVEKSPQDRLEGRDPQLDRAIEELRRQTLYYEVHGHRPYHRGNDREAVDDEMVRLYREWRDRETDDE